MSEKIKPNVITGRVDDIMRSGGYGERSEVYRDSVRGFNLIGTGQMTEPSRPTYGMVFITRPELNLTYDNLSREDTFLPCRDAPEYSILRMARVLLDPFNEVKFNHDKMTVLDMRGQYNDPIAAERIGCTCPLVDPNCAFIPMLTNRLLSISGWPDTRIDYYASDRGIRNEQWIMADGVAEHNGTFSLDLTFRNDKGDGPFVLHDLWVKYTSARFTNLYPYPEHIAMRVFEYFTRIYSFTLDETRTYITHWACTGGGFPTNISDGAIHNHNADNYRKDALDTISVQYQCVGAVYNNPVYLHLFNVAVARYNVELTLDSGNPDSYTNDGRDNIPLGNKNGKINWIKLTPEERSDLNFHAYPLINLQTKELEWWVRVDVYFAKYGSKLNGAVGNDAHTRVGKSNAAFKSGVVSQGEISQDDWSDPLKKQHLIDQAELEDEYE